jgi:glycosyltransferase involved in cell wall biosynthesis
VYELTVVAPVYNGELTVKNFVEQVLSQLVALKKTTQIILVDDGSTDQSWQEIEKLKSKIVSIKSLKLSKNYGQHIAILAGLREVNSKWTIVMDADLQENPIYIPRLYAEAKKLNESVVVKNNNLLSNSFLHKILRATFYKLFMKLIDFEFIPEIANYGIYEKNLIKKICTTKNQYPFFPALLRQSGYKLNEIEGVKERVEGNKSTYSYQKLLRHGLNIILSQSTRLMRVFVKIAIYSSLISVLFFLINLFVYFTSGSEVSGWMSLFSAILLFFSFLLVLISVIGTYVGNIYDILLDKPNFKIEKVMSINSEI